MEPLLLLGFSLLLVISGKPQILSLSVVDETCGQDSSAIRWLKCEVEGNPLPQVVWLSPSRSLLENQGQSFQSGPWQRTACLPYLEEEEEEEEQVITCRPENSEGHAEKRFPESNDLKTVVVVIGVSVAVLVLLSGVIIIIICFSNRCQQQVSDPPVERAELQTVYAEITSHPSAQVDGEQFSQRNGDPDVTYSPVKVQE